MPFCHLHVHDTYSLLDGFGLPIKFAQYAAETGQIALAQTNHGTIAGNIAHQAACKEAGVHPVFGVEFYVAEDMAKTGLTKEEEKDIALKAGNAREKSLLKSEAVKRRSKRSHLIALAINDQGYSNLRRLVSLSNLKGFYRKPRIDYKALEQCSEGLFISSACIAGDIPRLILADDMEGAKELALRLANICGEQFALEIMPLDMVEQRKVNVGIQQLARDLTIPVIATNDTHYIKREDAWTQDVLLAIGTNKKFTDPNRLRFGNGELFLRSEQEMVAAFRRHHPDLDPMFIHSALNFAYDVAFECKADPLKTVAELPEYDVPAGFESRDSYLQHLCRVGWKARRAHQWPAHVQAKYGQRVQYELGILKEKNFANYFLIVWDAVKWAKDRGIAVGPARGSSAGSLTAYLLGITDIDPIRFDLTFERFISPHRTDLPDIDVDFDYVRRAEVKNYLSEKYGPANVANIATFNTLGGRSAFRDAARVFEVPTHEVNKLLGGFYKEEESETELNMGSSGYQAFIARHPNVLKAAKAINGQLRSGGTHAAGVVLSDKPLMEVTAMEVKDGAPTVALTMNEAEALGLVKIDLLGLRAMTIINWAMEHANAKRKAEGREPITQEGIVGSLNDTRIFQEFAAGNTNAVFQFNKIGGRRLCQQIRVRDFEDLVAVNALDRPGPLDSGGTDAYVERRRMGTTRHIHPVYDEITSKTQGVLLFQEQVMRLCREMAGFDWAQVHRVRKLIAKSYGPEAIQEWWERFKEGACQNENCSEGTAQIIWNSIVTFGRYAFNRSHAVAYAAIGYTTMWLKVYYPMEYLSGYLRYATSEEAKRRAVVEARRRGVSVKEPDVNKSGIGFTPQDDAIYAGFDSVKGIGEEIAKRIVAARGEEPFKSIQDFLSRVPGKVNKRAVRSLVEVGAFESLHRNSTALLVFLDQENRTKKKGFLFDDIEVTEKDLNKRVKPDIKQIMQKVKLLPFTPESHPGLMFMKTLKKLDRFYPKRTTVTELRAAGRLNTRNEIRTITGVPTKFEFKTGDYGAKKKFGLLWFEDETGEIVIRMDPKRFQQEIDRLSAGAIIPLVAVVSPISEYRADVREIADLTQLYKRVQEGSYFTDSIEYLLDMPGKIATQFRKDGMRTIKRAVKCKKSTVVGLAMRVWAGNSKNGEMGFVDLTDETDQQIVLIWPNSWEVLKDRIEEGKIYEAVLGTLKDHTLCCDVARGHLFREVTPR